ncbi:MAG TPA: iron-sulfur cluster repair di-iron protein [Prolixibacteraceae bacterium]|nr:iron-sulfur cluster repair di-iron protein [Prolixibacteraceae bacterium]
MEKLIYSDKMLGDIVADDFRTAEVFKNAGIDFCCGGKKTLKQACEEKALNLEVIVQQIVEQQTLPISNAQNFKDWPLDFLCDYIVNFHHKYVFKTLPELVFYTRKIADVHGDNHPELQEVANLFGQINSELLQHLRNEEEILFPAIKQLLKHGNDEARNIVKSEITRMNGEHEFAGGAMDKINEITGGYQVPADGCNTYMVSFKLLKQFEDDLHIHVHLENNILFPKTLNL